MEEATAGVVKAAAKAAGRVAGKVVAKVAVETEVAKGVVTVAVETAVVATAAARVVAMEEVAMAVAGKAVAKVAVGTEVATAVAKAVEKVVAKGGGTAVARVAVVKRVVARAVAARVLAQWEGWAKMEVVGLEAALAAGWADVCREDHLCTTQVKKGGEHFAELSQQAACTQVGARDAHSVLGGKRCVQSVQSVPIAHPSYSAPGPPSSQLPSSWVAHE